MLACLGRSGGQWWQELSESQQDAVAARVELLMEYGPNLPFPYSSGTEARGTELCVSFEHKAAEGRSGYLRFRSQANVNPAYWR